MTGKPRGALATIGRWTFISLLIGAGVGTCFMFDRTPIFAESGGKPSNYGFYAFWIPWLAGFGAVVGLGLGVIAVIVREVREVWPRSSVESRIRRSVVKTDD